MQLRFTRVATERGSGIGGHWDFPVVNGLRSPQLAPAVATRVSAPVCKAQADLEGRGT